MVIPFAAPDEQFLREAIDSIVAQTYERWEIVLADDGDRASDGEMVRAIIAPLRGRARVVTHAEPGNRGISAARNTGIRHSRGEFIAFLDADDVYLPHKLELAVSTLAANPDVGMLCSNTRYWHSWSAENDSDDFVPDLGSTGIFQPPDLLCRWLGGESAVPSTCSFTVRKTTFDAVRGFVERFRGLYEDQAFLAKVALTQRIMLVDNVTALYRQHPASMCSVASDDRARAGRRTFLRWLARYVRYRDLSFPELAAVIEGEQWKVRHPRLAKARRLIGKAMDRALGERTA